MNLASLKVTEDEESWSVEGLEAAIEKVADRYPYLLAEEWPVSRDEKVRSDPVSSGSAANGARQTGGGVDRAQLAKKFPALRR